jgi:hypothetical protein
VSPNAKIVKLRRERGNKQNALAVAPCASARGPIIFVSVAGADLYLPMRPMRKEIQSKKSVPRLESTQGAKWFSVFGPQRVLS